MAQDDREQIETDRRTSVRLASHQRVEAAVLDHHNQPISVLRDAEVVNVSAGGLMFLSDTPTQPGTKIVINLAGKYGSTVGEHRFSLTTLECTPSNEGRHKIRCELAEGAVPARFIYNW